jgi:hypothetical protein
MDASGRLTRFYEPQRLFELVYTEQIEPYTMLQHTFHSIKATTAPGRFFMIFVNYSTILGFYDYIPMPETIIQIYRMDSAGIQLIVPVNYTRTIMKWCVSAF